MGLGNTNQVTTPKLHSLNVTQALNGVCIPIVYGQNRLVQNLLWTGDFTSAQPYQQGGKGLGKNGSAYEYYSAIVGALCQGPISGIGNIWSQNGRLGLNSASEAYTVPSGGGTYTVSNAAAFSSDAGVGQLQAYNVTANDYGSPGPVTLSGTQTAPLQYTAGTPGSGQYTYTSAGQYTFPAADAGTTVTIAYNYSLYTLDETEDDTIPYSYPFEITVQYATQITADLGVIYVFTGLPLTRVGGSPSVGEYSESSGNYTFAPGDAGNAVAISYAWQQTDSNVDPSSTLQFTLIEGTQGQEAWTYLQSKHASQAFGYSTIALVCTPKMDLGESAQLPNYNYEVIALFQFGAGIVDADVAACIQDLLTNPYYGAQFQGTLGPSLTTIARDYWNANSFFISPILNSAQPASEIIQQWCDAGNVGLYWSEGQLKFIPYGDTTQVANGYTFSPQTAPVVDLNDDDFLSDASEDPVQIERTPWQDAFNQVKVQFTNRVNNYNPDVVTEQDDYAIQEFGLRPEGQQDHDFLCTAAAATFAANIRLKRLVYIRKQYKFKISAVRYCFLEPMDLVTVTDVMLGLNKEPVRITAIEEDENRIYSITAEEFPWGTATATIYDKQPGQPGPPPPSLASPGDTSVVAMFEPTSRAATTGANAAYQIWMALNGGPNWGGCNVWVSYDDASYEQLVPVQYGPSRCGTLTASLPVAADPDSTDTLAVSVSGELYNVTLAQVNALATISLILSAAGTEYLAYQNVTLTGTAQQGDVNNYNLNYLRRGQFSSPILAHASGDVFVRLDSQVYQFSYDPSLAQSQIWFKFTSFNLLQNQVQSLDEVMAVPFQVIGSNLANNMTVDSVLDGTSADIRIYQTGQAVGTPGTAQLSNGATISLPAVTQTGENLYTTYYVNFNQVANTYVFYTDMSQWLSDETVLGYIRIGYTTTPNGAPSGTAATFSVNTIYTPAGENGNAQAYYTVTSVTVTNGGSGYAPNTFGVLDGLFANGATGTASQRKVTMTVSGGVITAASITSAMTGIQWLHVPAIADV